MKLPNEANYVIKLILLPFALVLAVFGAIAGVAYGLINIWFACICYDWASRIGKNRIVALLIGFFFSILGLGLYYTYYKTLKNEGVSRWGGKKSKFPIKFWQWPFYLIGLLFSINPIFWLAQFIFYKSKQEKFFFSYDFHKRTYWWGLIVVILFLGNMLFSWWFKYLGFLVQ